MSSLDTYVILMLWIVCFYMKCLKYAFFVQQHELEHIYLSDDDLKSLKDKTNDFFEYLKFQAQHGDVESQVSSSRCYFNVRADNINNIRFI